MAASVAGSDLSRDPGLSLLQLLDPAVIADPYPFYRHLRETSPVHWDPFSHTWVVTRYDEVLSVLQGFSADRSENFARMDALGLGDLGPIANVMAQQMLFLDAPQHTRLRKLCASAFTPRRVEAMEAEIQAIVDGLIDAVAAQGAMDVVADLAEPLPAIVTAGLLGVPIADHSRIKAWSIDFAQMFGNLQHNQQNIAAARRSLDEMTAYFRAAMHEEDGRVQEGLIGSLMRAEVDGAQLSEDEIIANIIITVIGGHETSTNLIASGLLTLIRQPDRLRQLRDDPALVGSAVEELLRYESLVQHTARIAPADTVMGGRLIKRGTGVTAVIAAANRDPARFADPDRLDLARPDNRHLAFGWGAHFCFGAPLARMEARIAFTTLLRRLDDIMLATDRLEWHSNLGLRGLKALPVRFRAAAAAMV